MSRNRLANEPSPYLLQHKDNPVHWFPWGDDAFAEARATGKPVLLSIGYAACHWCHVMAHESFEDQATADLMNELFVNIKLDREERPDIDRIYMEALQHLGQQGGWPLTMFLNADRQPFWGGTYFPKSSQFGRPSFTQVLRQISEIYKTSPENVENSCNALVDALRRAPRTSADQSHEISIERIDETARQVQSVIDYRHGGLQGAPKFPQFPILHLLWRHHVRTGDKTSRNAVLVTLHNICQGGIYDHLRGGIARYSVDTLWLVPHFEKMLYDNAQFLDILALVWKSTGDELFRIRIEETIAWVSEEMVTERQAFAASLDADSEGEEGKFYVWSHEEITGLLGTDAPLFCRTYDVTPGGNWEHANILNRRAAMDLLNPATERILARCRRTLLDARNKRVRPGFDDKILTDWNGLMIAGIARCGHVFERADWLEIAQRAYDGVKAVLSKDNRFSQSHRNGQTRYGATADGYANMIRAALQLHEATGDKPYLTDALDWMKTTSDLFWDTDSAGYFYTSADARDLIRRTRTAADDATPNANATQLTNLGKLYLLTGDETFRRHGLQTLDAFRSEVAAAPIAHAGFLNGAEDFMDPLQAIVILADNPEMEAGFRKVLNSLSLPTLTTTTYSKSDDIPQGHPVSGKTAGRDTTLFICRGQVCSLPITHPSDVAKALELVQRPSSDR